MAVKYTLHVEGNDAAELADAIADLAVVVGSGMSQEQQSGAVGTDPEPEPAQDDTPPPSPQQTKRGSKGKSKSKAKPVEDEGDGSSLDDVKSVAQDLIDAVGGDMERAQELVHSEWKVRRVSELDPGQYDRFIRWTKEQVELLQEIQAQSPERDTEEDD